MASERYERGETERALEGMREDPRATDKALLMFADGAVGRRALKVSRRTMRNLSPFQPWSFTWMVANISKPTSDSLVRFKK